MSAKQKALALRTLDPGISLEDGRRLWKHPLDLTWPQATIGPTFYPVACRKCGSRAIAERVSPDGFHYVGCKDCLFAVSDRDPAVARRCWGER